MAKHVTAPRRASFVVLLLVGLVGTAAPVAAVVAQSAQYGFPEANRLRIEGTIAYTGPDAQRFRDAADADDDGFVDADEEAAYREVHQGYTESVEGGPAAAFRLDDNRVAAVRLDEYAVSDFEGPAESADEVTVEFDVTFSFERIDATADRHVFREAVPQAAATGGNTSVVTLRAMTGFVVASYEGLESAILNEEKTRLSGRQRTGDMVVTLETSSAGAAEDTPGLGAVAVMGALLVVGLRLANRFRR